VSLATGNIQIELRLAMEKHRSVDDDMGIPPHHMGYLHPLAGDLY
jgi:hypothetical protein